jgi:cytochrome c oxidase cbb3-type subunit 1
VIGGWTGGRHLIGGPVPAWIPSVAIVAAVLLLFHYIVVLLNLGRSLAGGSTALRFVGCGVLAYVLGGIVDAVVSFRSIAVVTELTWFTQAQTQLALYGAFSLTIFGAIYFLAPRLAGRAWPSSPLLRAHFAATIIGTVGLVAGLAVTGLIQGQALSDPAVTVAGIASETRVWLELAIASQALLVVGNALLGFHFIRLVLPSLLTPAAADTAIFRQPPAMEAPAS